jgi:hypothetical protein
MRSRPGKKKESLGLSAWHSYHSPYVNSCCFSGCCR